MRSNPSRRHFRISAVLWLAFALTPLWAQSDGSTDAGLPPGDRPESGTTTIIVNKAFHDREIKVRPGDLIRVELEELGSAGYQWTIPDLATEYFEVVGSRTQPPPPAGEITGAPVKRSWTIRAKKEGRSALRFIHCRPWESEELASERFLLKVRIIP